MKNRILDYMKKYGSITTWDAFIDLGCTRLSEYIRQLREEYEVISSAETRINRYGEEVRIKRFSLGEKYE